VEQIAPIALQRAALERPVALRAFSEGKGPALCMLGGGIAGAAGFASHAAELANEFRVIRLQTLNVECADSRHALPPRYSIKLESEAMRAALDVIAPTEQLDIVGHSFGALVALDFSLDHPGRVRSLVLSEPPAFWVVPRDELQASADMQRITTLVRQFRPTREATDADLAEFLRTLGHSDTNAPEQDDVRWVQWLRARRCLQGLSAVPDHTDNLERLKNFRRPVLLVAGANSPRFHRRINGLLAAYLPSVETVELPGGHQAVNTARDAFLRCLRSFLAKSQDA
jgi:pimeloyl-ACP methyl ester carboxylesterase